MQRFRRAIKIIGPVRLVVACTLGFCLNIGIAWWLAWNRPHRFNSDWTFVERPDEWGSIEVGEGLLHWCEYNGRTGFQRTQLSVTPPPHGEGKAEESTPRYARGVLRRLRLTIPPNAANPQWQGSAQIETYGWPIHIAKTAHYRWTEHRDQKFIDHVDDYLWGFRPGMTDREGNDIILPINPMPTLPFGVLTHTVVIYGLASIPACVSGLRRHLTNRCHRCGYSLDGLTADACPECGDGDRRQNASTAQSRVDSKE